MYMEGEKNRLESYFRYAFHLDGKRGYYGHF